ncbi:prepilin peptidase [Paraglaciecola chathamensis]|uniref:Prepilin leader peptidase/N-methyltransferase n=2 Tax=Paraglaciecola chathamensis TaxID=368405 RepID=A0A8H9IC44_9ALTE|nr:MULTISPECIES: A24 family peptidase [Paraglaciecola]GAC10424.1 type 4 prepilin-like proteins leader peptide-processing enzyme [Paraglaciecola chathamensis S18K6]GGZ46949.1 type 4 prepilin-like proteins leader peptide-processing enzyme [Paraglaciecola oceanifecundans]
MDAIFQLMADSPLFFLSFVFIVSLMVGSFLNVVIYRLPVMMERSWKADFQAHFETDVSTLGSNTDSTESTPFNLIKPDSTCPKCQHKIRAWENIPVISWLLLRGKCSQCKNAISIRYPLIELGTALCSVWIAWHFGYSWSALAGVVMTWILVALIFIDIDTMLLPDQLTLPLLWMGLLFSIVNPAVSSADSIIGATVGYLSLWSVYWAFKLLTGKEGMGYGDFKLLAALGAWMGWQYLAIVVLMSSLVGAVIGISVLSFQGKDKGQAIPFGPYLAIAGWLTLLYGDWISTKYWQWVGL